jgi:hypothetical protein
VDALLGSLKTKQYAPIRCFSVSAKEQGTLTPSLAAIGRLLTDWPVLPVLLRIDPTPAHVRAAMHARQGLMGRRWIILEGGNREGVLAAVSSGAGVWGFERWRRGV